jgi:hypothetical protein
VIDYKDNMETNCIENPVTGTEEITTAGQVASISVTLTSLPLLFYNPVVFLQLLDILQIIRFILFIDIAYPMIVIKFF